MPCPFLRRSHRRRGFCELAAHPLSDSEVIAVLIGGGRNGDRPLAVAHHPLTDWGGLPAVLALTLALLRHCGLRDTQAAVLLAASERARRLARQYIPDHHVLAIFHTHPSGDPTPSAEEGSFTKRMKDAAEVMGVDLLDHLVLGATGRWASLPCRGAWCPHDPR